MKKIFSLMIAVMAMFAMTINAQTFEQPKFIDNTYFRVEGGATALTHPGCTGYEDWGHTIQGVIGAEIGKWITPKFGVAFEGDFGIRNGSTKGVFNYYNWNRAALSYDEQKNLLKKANRFNYINVTGLAKFNMSNIIAGFNPDRKWEFVMATGPMWIHGFPSNIHNAHELRKEDPSARTHNYKNDFGVKFKAEVNYNLNQHIQFNLIPEFNYNLTAANESACEHPKFDSRNSWYGLKVGVTYKIGKQFTECPYRYTQADVDALNDEINTLRARKPETVTQVVEKVVTKEVNTQTVYVVAFDYGKAELDQAGRDVLNAIPTDVVVDVQGEASYPGSAQFNQKLSERRANVVAGYLANRGVKVGDCTGVGATGHQIVKVIVK